MKISLSQSLNENDLQHKGPKYDQREGIGAVPYNASIDYFGCKVWMKPSTFLYLALPLERKHADAVEYLKIQMLAGKPLGSPFMNIALDRVDGKLVAQNAKVTGHEGRNRMYAIQEIYGEILVLVHLLFSGEVRARNLTDELMNQLNRHLIPQGKTQSVQGPFWTNF